jgi:putative nucleotidyltransferase with HDIG domain
MNANKILVIEENNKKREQLEKFLSGLALETEIISSIPENLQNMIQHKNFSMVVIHFNTLTSQSIEIIQNLKKSLPQLGVIMLADSQKIEGYFPLLQQGVINHIVSPDHLGSLFSALKNEWEKRELAQENTYYLKSLKKLRSEQSRSIQKAMELEEIYDTTLENLMTALDLRDVETFGHSQTVAKYSQALAELLGIMDKNQLDNIRKGALLHDVGKIAIPDSILKKPNPLSREEWEKVRLHPSLGFGFIKEIKLVKEVGNIILYHHERYDGNGYSKGLKREEIPLEARIFALADALDAITSHRPYRKERDFPAAKREIEHHASAQFDPQVVEAFCSLRLEKWERIRFETTKLLPAIEDFSKVKNPKT